MKIFLLIITLFILSFTNVLAQYQIGIGARLGKFNNGITFKEFFYRDEKIGIEGQLFSSLIAATYGYTMKGFLIDQVTFRVPFVQLPLDFVMGGGLQIGYFPYDAPGYYKIVDGKPDYYGKSVVNAGIAATIGIEYQIKKRVAPFTIGVDIVPAYEFVNPGPEWIDFGVDLRYVIR